MSIMNATLSGGGSRNPGQRADAFLASMGGHASGKRPRQYMCKQCGLPKKGHTCPKKQSQAVSSRTAKNKARVAIKKQVLMSSDDESEDESEDGSDGKGKDESEDDQPSAKVSKSCPGSPTSPSYRPTSPKLSAADLLASPIRGPLMMSALPPPPPVHLPTPASASSALIAIEKHFDEERKALDLARQELDNYRKEVEKLIETQKKTVCAKELASMKKELEGTKKELEGTKKELEGTKKELEGTKKELEGTKQDGPCNLFEVRTSLVDKITHLFNEELNKNGTSEWMVEADTGKTSLPPGASDKVEECVKKWEKEPHEVFTDVYSVPVNGKTFSYTLRFEPGMGYPAPQVWQVNQETQKKRRLTKETHDDLAKRMNMHKFPLGDATGKFVFEEELEMLKKGRIPVDSYSWESQGNSGVKGLAESFTKPYNTAEVHEGQEWCRGPLLYQTLALAKQQHSANPSGSGWFVWAHGTATPASIRDNTTGMNVRYTDSGCVKGRGVYVATNPLVPLHFSKVVKGAPMPCYVMGLATFETENDFERYRMTPHLRVEDEPDSWRTSQEKHAIYIQFPNQMVGMFPFGCVYCM